MWEPWLAMESSSIYSVLINIEVQTSKPWPYINNYLAIYRGGNTILNWNLANHLCMVLQQVQNSKIIQYIEIRKILEVSLPKVLQKVLIKLFYFLWKKNLKLWNSVGNSEMLQWSTPALRKVLYLLHDPIYIDGEVLLLMGKLLVGQTSPISSLKEGPFPPPLKTSLQPIFTVLISWWWKMYAHSHHS